MEPLFCLEFRNYQALTVGGGNLLATVGAFVIEHRSDIERAICIDATLINQITLFSLTTPS